ncbi:MAG: virulence protein RhuM/Fic/DOC family protein [Candidatus Gracilibacteria bacterium]|nr:virulence protein RhuM/Fic/DOC family protein [Candidatus Gracilibacteria bacterium]
MTAKKNEQILIYQAANGELLVRLDANKETIWLSLDQIALLFERDKSVVSRHLRNIFIEGELDRDGVVAKIATTAADGKKYQVEHYNLDVIISIGYRVNGKKATDFRKWATNILRSHLTEGYTINKSRIVTNYTAFLRAVDDIKALLPENTRVDNTDILELVSVFAETWFSLDAYDRDALVTEGVTKESVVITTEELSRALVEFKKVLIQKGEASELFASERDRGSFAGIIGNVFQSFAGDDLYPSIEEKAAHLLYFIIKNHPFADGNKRSGAYVFIWFLSRTHILDKDRLTPTALTALTLLIAESDPKDKERMVGLVLQILRKV